MTSPQILAELKSLASENIKKIFAKHGAKEPFYGVKIEDLKKVQKKIKENHQQLAMELFASGISEAQYLAGLMADGGKMSTKELKTWAKASTWQMISEYTVPWVASENKNAWPLAMEWIDSPKENIASTGWATLSSIMATWPDERIDVSELKKLLSRVEKEIHKAPNRVRYCMNGFVIAAGSFMKDLTSLATAAGKKIGPVTVDMNGTSCKVPFAPDYIRKVADKGYIGRKKKTAKC